ncbi:MAG: hypothetical protein HQL50_08235 [Magnetococcales bacterium]|nr:hypothetical protein [Magnetococcales bacterium]
MIDLNKALREELRWQILQALDAGRPEPVSEAVLLRILKGKAASVSRAGLQREVGYLHSKQLVRIMDGSDSIQWLKISAVGVDVLENTISPPAGIIRP